MPPMGDTQTTIILASGSELRRRLLENAGVAFASDPPSIDEQEVKLSLGETQATSTQIAETLAELKAQRVAIRHPGRLVVGADQILDCDGTIFDKPGDIERARTDLMALRGKTHLLVTSVVAVRDGDRLWHHNDQSSLTMRAFSVEFIDNYLEKSPAGPANRSAPTRLKGSACNCSKRSMATISRSLDYRFFRWSRFCVARE